MRTIKNLLSEGGAGVLAGRTVLVRSDLNVPLDGDRITDDGRIRAAVPTISELTGAGAKVIVTAHLGRPRGEPSPEFSLAPVAARLGELLGTPVRFATLAGARPAVGAMAAGEVLLVENIRFDPRETSQNDNERAGLARELAALTGEDGAFVSDGFGVIHRRQASVYDVAEDLPAYAGGLVAAEVEVLRTLTEAPKRPYAVVLGGSKVSDKLAVIEALLPKVDWLLVGGGMCFTFLAAQNLDRTGCYGVGSSLLEEDRIDVCRTLMESGKVVLPSDVVVADAFAVDAATQVVGIDAIPDCWMGLDIGPASVRAFAEVLSAAATVFWNGPMGVFEMAPFAQGTRGVAQTIVGSSAFSVVGGGDSAAAVRVLGLPEDGFSHISTGGGASLEYLEGKTLPGLAVLEPSRQEMGGVGNSTARAPSAINPRMTESTLPAVGATATVSHQVSSADIAQTLGTGEVPVLASSRLLTWAEGATCAAIDADLDETQTSVGTKLQLDHTRPSPLDTTVTVRAELIRVDGRLLEFEFRAEHDDGQVVGRGEVTRMMVDRQRFLERAAPTG